jgi:uncharacterized protein YifN (PemK superfamily)
LLFDVDTTLMSHESFFDPLTQVCVSDHLQGIEQQRLNRDTVL